MTRIALLLGMVGLLSAASFSAQAHEILARSETSALSAADRHIAANAEAEALDRDEAVRDFAWRGPDGASGLIIVSGHHPDFYGMGRCRNLIHIIRHPADGGVNATFEGTVCRDWEGRWSLERR